MDRETMSNIWDELSEEDRIFLRKSYQEMKEISNKNKDLYDNMLEDQVKRLEEIFGKENLKCKPPIKTWEDYEKILSEDALANINNTLDNIAHLPRIDFNRSNPIYKKMVATYKIARLIELSYGGMITEEEWENPEKAKYILVERKGIIVDDITYTYRNFIAFHTKEQLGEFFKNNYQLCKEYYLM